MTRTLSLLILLIASHAFAQSVSVPTEVRGLPGTFVVVRATTDGGSVQWYSCDPGLSLIPPELLKDGKAAVVMAPQPGRYRLIAWTAKGDVPSPPAVCVVIVGEPGPDPPKPDPIPPKPDPPIPAGDLRVLIVYESGELSKMPLEQHAILFSKQVRDWLSGKTPLGPDGKTREWRIYDRDVDLSAESDTWKQAMSKSKAVPGIVVLRGDVVAHEGPLPEDVGKTLELLERLAK